MSICEGCIKQDVCKFKEEVEKYEKSGKRLKLPKPLESGVFCKYKESSRAVTFTPYYVPYPCYVYPYYTLPDVSIPSVCPDITDPMWTTTCGSTSSDYIAIN